MIWVCTFDVDRCPRQKQTGPIRHCNKTASRSYASGQVHRECVDVLSEAAERTAKTGSREGSSEEGESRREKQTEKAQKGTE